nr:immunoglobulin light chain junction region [Macaca mulatta]
CLLYDSGAWVF